MLQSICHEGLVGTYVNCALNVTSDQADGEKFPLLNGPETKFGKFSNRLIDRQLNQECMKSNPLVELPLINAFAS